MKQTFTIDSKEIMGIVLEHLRRKKLLRSDSAYSGSTWTRASRLNPMAGFEMTFEFEEENDG